MTNEYDVMLNSEHKQGMHQSVKHTMCKECFPEVFTIEDQQEQYDAIRKVLMEMKRLGIIRATWDFNAGRESARNEIELWMYDANGVRTKALFNADFFQLHSDE